MTSLNNLHHSRELLLQFFQTLNKYEIEFIEALESNLKNACATNFSFRDERLTAQDLARITILLNKKKNHLDPRKNLVENPKEWHFHDIRETLPIAIEIAEGLNIRS